MQLYEILGFAGPAGAGDRTDGIHFADLLVGVRPKPYGRYKVLSQYKNYKDAMANSDSIRI